MKGTVKFGKVDATEEKSLAQEYGVSGYPTIKYWEYGLGKSKSNSKAYKKGRTASDLTQFASKLLESSDIEPEVNQLTEQKVFDDSCAEGVCIISFLPPLDTAKERNGFVDVLKEVAKKNLGKPFNFVWVSGGDNGDLENQLGLGFGWPAVVVINKQKKLYSVMRGSFGAKQIGEMLDSIMIGKMRLNKMPADLKFKKVDTWDGKDAPPLEEETEFEE